MDYDHPIFLYRMQWIHRHTTISWQTRDDRIHEDLTVVSNVQIRPVMFFITNVNGLLPKVCWASVFFCSRNNRLFSYVALEGPCSRRTLPCRCYAGRACGALQPNKQLTFREPQIHSNFLLSAYNCGVLTYPHNPLFPLS